MIWVSSFFTSLIPTQFSDADSGRARARARTHTHTHTIGEEEKKKKKKKKKKKMDVVQFSGKFISMRLAFENLFSTFQLFASILCVLFKSIITSVRKLYYIQEISLTFHISFLNKYQAVENNQKRDKCTSLKFYNLNRESKCLIPSDVKKGEKKLGGERASCSLSRGDTNSIETVTIIFPMNYENFTIITWIFWIYHLTEIKNI